MVRALINQILVDEQQVAIGKIVEGAESRSLEITPQWVVCSLIFNARRLIRAGW